MRCRWLLHLRRLGLRGRLLRKLCVGVDGEEAIDVLHVVDVQRAGRLVEQQPVLQVVVLGDGVGLARVEQVLDRKSVVSGKSVSVRVDLGGRRIIKKKITTNPEHCATTTNKRTTSQS